MRNEVEDSGDHLILSPVLVPIHDQLDPSLCLVGVSSVHEFKNPFHVLIKVYVTSLAGTSTTPPLPQFLRHTREKSPIVHQVLLSMSNNMAEQ